MRLHHLSLTAFGPFPGTESIDFDELNDAGLFLLTGPTGAGKTSILDAVCFALFGSVPGVRGAKTLKSQHAAADVRPEVVLDFGIGERRFVVRRSPEWVRPKRKGAGFKTEPASAAITETTHGEDHFLSSRAQEVGHLVAGLVGMNASQFVQVAMLPQGEFAKFLHATSQERHDVLQHLFKTDRFARIEDWVHDHSRQLSGRAEAGRAEVLRVLHTIADRAAVTPPDDLSGAGAESALTWADEILGAAEVSAARLREAHERAGQQLGERRAAHEDATRLLAVLKRRSAAVGALSAVSESAAADEEDRARLDADDRAARCAATLRIADQATSALKRACAERDRQLHRLSALEAGLVDHPAEPDTASLTLLDQQLRSRITRLQSLVPRARARDVAVSTAQDDERTLALARVDLREHTARQRLIPGELSALRERLGVVAAAAGRSEALTLELTAAQARLAAAEQVPALERLLLGLKDAERAARDRAADAREHHQDVIGRRLAGIAAELAGRLQQGQACQVCGSTEHPAPAPPLPGSVTEAEQEQANTDLEARAEDYRSATADVAEADHRLAVLAEAAGGLDVASARQRVEDLDQAVSAARLAHDEHGHVSAAITALTTEQESLTAVLHELSTTLVTTTQSLNTQQATIAAVTEEIRSASGPLDPAARLEDSVRTLESALEVVAAVTAAVSAHDRAAAKADELLAEAVSTAAAQGFPGVAAARAALLPRDERSRLEDLLHEHAEAEARARAVLDDPEVAGLGDQQPPDTTASAAALGSAEESCAAAARADHLQEQLVFALTGLRARLQDTLAEWHPLRADSDRAESMSKLVRGMGSDNQLQMRLSAYVLATRLDQVVDAANERLAHMRDQRYLLQRTGRASRRGSQAGLALEVLDQWTGEARDPATLSGGETFVVSLSLALGLADVVTQEAGGTEIETLFVDEGFGTLDADTLDDVMDRLDGLRAGGRTVGVVSHVTELRTRIPTQVHVEKRRDGSTVAVRTLVG
jgi:DNA repair protein SbcC/Rad50